MQIRRCVPALATVMPVLVMTLASPAHAQQEPRFSTGGTCDFSNIPGVVWFGTQRHMPIQQLASYLAPVYWFSPDEPLLNQLERDSMVAQLAAGSASWKN